MVSELLSSVNEKNIDECPHKNLVEKYKAKFPLVMHYNKLELIDNYYI
jgi:hypothetical protein